MTTATTVNGTKRAGFADEKVDGLLEQLRALRPMIQKNASEGEKQRSPMKEVEKALRELEVFYALLPTRWGGGGFSTTAFAKVQMELAKGDPSISWVNQILNGQTWVATLGSDALQEGLFSKGPISICGANNPPGKARKVDGGYIVSGNWPYSSGSRQAEWVQGGCVITSDEAEGPVFAGINMAYIPMDQIEIVDTWYVTGMQGTGSDTTVAKEAFVPDHLMVTMDKPFGHVEPGKRHYGAASDFLSVVPTVRTTGVAQLIGAAEYMLELLEKDVPKKPIITTTFKTRGDSGAYMHNLGKAAAQIDNAKLLLLDACGFLDHAATNGIILSEKDKAKNKAQGAQVIDLVHEAIETIMFLAGSSAFLLNNPMQRYWRDVHVGLRHITNIPYIGYEIYARDRAELKPNISPPGAY